MLVLSRRIGTSLAMFPDEKLSLETPIGAFTWPMHVLVVGIRQNDVRLGIEADAQIVVLRDDVRSRNARDDGMSQMNPIGQQLAAALTATERALQLARPVTTPDEYQAIADICARLSQVRAKLEF